MNLQDAQKLLLAVSTFDGRPVNEDIVQSWHTVLWNVQYEQAMEAMRQHFSTSDRRLMPVHIIQGVKKIRAELLKDYQGPGLSREIPQGDPDNVPQYLEGERVKRQRIADGEAPPQVLQLMRGIGRMPKHIMNREATPMVVACSNPECRALVGRQCRNRRGDTRAPHEERMEAFRGWREEQDGR